MSAKTNPCEGAFSFWMKAFDWLAAMDAPLSRTVDAMDMRDWPSGARWANEGSVEFVLDPPRFVVPPLGCKVIAQQAGQSTVIAMIGLTIAAASASSAQASFWMLPPAILNGAAAAAGIALVDSVGNIGGFTSTFVVGWMKDLTHSTSGSLYLFAGLLFVAGLLILTIPGRLVNK